MALRGLVERLNVSNQVSMENNAPAISDENGSILDYLLCVANNLPSSEEKEEEEKVNNNLPIPSEEKEEKANNLPILSEECCIDFDYCIM